MWFCRGRSYLEPGEQRNFGKAVKCLKQAIEHDSSTWTFPRHDLALAYLEAGDYAAAQEKFREANDNAGDQQTGYLHYNLGLLAHQLGKRKEAELEYQTARQLFENQAKQEEGRNAPERAVVFRNDAAEAYNALGALWAGEGKHRQAAEAYEQSLKLNPNLEAARRNLDLLQSRGKKLAKH